MGKKQQDEEVTPQDTQTENKKEKKDKNKAKHDGPRPSHKTSSKPVKAKVDDVVVTKTDKTDKKAFAKAAAKATSEAKASGVEVKEEPKAPKIPKPKVKFVSEPLVVDQQVLFHQETPGKVVENPVVKPASKDQLLTWTNDSKNNLSVTAYDGEDEKVYFVAALKPGYPFKCAKPYNYLIIDKPHKQTLKVGSDLKKNNASLTFSETSKMLVFN